MKTYLISFGWGPWLGKSALPYSNARPTYSKSLFAWPSTSTCPGKSVGHCQLVPWMDHTVGRLCSCWNYFSMEYFYRNLWIMRVHCCRHEGVVHSPWVETVKWSSTEHLRVRSNTKVSSLMPSYQRPAGVRIVLRLLLCVCSKLDKSKRELVTCSATCP